MTYFQSFVTMARQEVCVDYFPTDKGVSDVISFSDIISQRMSKHMLDLYLFSFVYMGVFLNSCFPLFSCFELFMVLQVDTT